MEIVILLELIQYKHTPPITSTAHRTKIVSETGGHILTSLRCLNIIIGKCKLRKYDNYVQYVEFFSIEFYKYQEFCI